MVKENNMKLVSPILTVKDIPKKAGKGASTTLSSVVISVAVIAAISLIGVAFAYGLGHFSNIPTSLDKSGICADQKLGFEQKGYYNNMEQFKAALESCSS
jgi:hypothetical protein